MRPNFTRVISLVTLAVTSLSLHAQELTVSAAASLSDAFKEIATQYQKQNPGVIVRLNTGASGALLQQALQGAPVDVLAVADQKTMDMAVDKQAVDISSRRTFARNDLVLIVPKTSSVKLNTLNDLTQSKINRISVSNPDSVPVGRYSKAALEKANLFDALKPKIINTQNVRQSLDYVARGEVDAGFVYRTDAALMPNKVKVSFIVPLDTPVSYPIAVTTNTQQKVQAKQFIDLVQSKEGRNILKKYGFSQP